MNEYCPVIYPRRSSTDRRIHQTTRPRKRNVGFVEPKFIFGQIHSSRAVYFPARDASSINSRLHRRSTVVHACWISTITDDIKNSGVQDFGTGCAECGVPWSRRD